MYKYLVLFQFILTIIHLTKADDGTIVETTNGKIQGKIEKNLQGTNYYAFEGVPYAAPPVGDNRLKIPSEPNNWANVLETLSNQKTCMQMLDGLPIGSEDCLYLNVYTPQNPSKRNGSLPVMVVIHGGAFQTGFSGIANPGYLMDYEIILVSINYRIGVFGFLSTNDSVIPGNLGLKDQRFALQWVSKNIKNFGGNPDKVTLFGQSAGAISISYQLLFPQNKGLFRGAIMDSGSSLCHHDFQPNPRKFALELQKIINPCIRQTDSKAFLTTLKTVSAEKLLLASMEVTEKYSSDVNKIQLPHLNNVWLPVVENSDTQESFITKPMHQKFIDGDFLKVPMLAGFNSEEIVYFSDLPLVLPRVTEIDSNPEKIISEKLNVNDEVAAGIELKSVYNNFENPNLIIPYLSDNYYTTPVLRQADLVYNHTNLYLYQFSYTISTNTRPRVPGAENVGHTEELQFLFGNETFLNQMDNTTHKRMIKLWTNFVKYQNPTPTEDELLINWPKVTANLNYYNINETLSVLQNPKKYKGWKTVLEKYIQKPYNVY